MTSGFERSVYEALRGVIAGLKVGDPVENWDARAVLLSALQFYVPQVLAEVHPHWQWEGLDFFEAGHAIMTAERQAEVIGMCCLIRDMTWTPIYVHLRHSGSDQTLEWMECRVGARGDGDGGLLRLPNLDRSAPRRIAQRPYEVDWAYAARFGDEEELI